MGEGERIRNGDRLVLLFWELFPKITRIDIQMMTLLGFGEIHRIVSIVLLPQFIFSPSTVYAPGFIIATFVIMLNL